MAAIEFINRQRDNANQKAMRRVIKYILREDKTKDNLSHGILCNKDSAYEDFIQVKKLFGKEGGRQYIHFIQSFSPNDDITPETTNEIAQKLISLPVFQGFQMVFATHMDKPHLHTHFVINSVNAETGKKWQLSCKEMQALKDFSDELCLEYGCSVLDGKTKQTGHRSKGEYYRRKDSTSWKYELFLAVTATLKFAVNREDFVRKMKELGYRVIWQDNRTYVTFITPDGKRCRNRKLYPPERFTKEHMESIFERNRQFAEKKENDQRQTELRQKWNLLTEMVYVFRNSLQSSKNSQYPLSRLEGEALKEYMMLHDNEGEIRWDNEMNSEEDFEV